MQILGEMRTDAVDSVGRTAGLPPVPEMFTAAHGLQLSVGLGIARDVDDASLLSYSADSQTEMCPKADRSQSLSTFIPTRRSRASLQPSEVSFAFTDISHDDPQTDLELRASRQVETRENGMQTSPAGSFNSERSSSTSGSGGRLSER
eukprot:gnl/TRDRNA2_/TRDRNA2_77079_c0_seq1.p1 gnl/TRDRNA2_/TRDRNA2_77079_c0~~gnl/TRDRNA2_/TRDRNA2_77079_c0_seq1.p1  ORF type:complete len:148 (-),score=16.55 gnl/TRDRNA2_/TRDRNA2_77079_c0_seq1:146-589(-)